MGVSLFALAAVSALGNTTSFAQTATDAPETVVVTGTSIRGVPPIGSDLQTVSAGDLQATGGATITEQLAASPVLTGFGGSGRGSDGGNPGEGQELNIHQIGSNAQNSTLVLMDGHRLPFDGTGNSVVDPNTIPVNMIQRVDVLAEGASATYGADAVAGVVNIITRRSFQGLQFDEQTSWANGLSPSKVVSVLMGNNWSGGGAIASFDYNWQGALSDIDRPSTNPLLHPAQATAAGLSGTGQTNFGNFNCSPATIQPNGTGNIYLNAQGTTNVANASANQTCSQWAYADLFPDERRQHGMIRLTQNFGSKLSVTADLLYYNVSTTAATSRGTLTAYGFGTGAQANPFYTNPPGITATKQQIRYDFDQLLGPGAYTLSGYHTLSGTIDANYAITNDWDVEFLGVNGDSFDSINTTGTVNQGVATLDLNGTNQAGGSTTASSLAGYNAIITQLPLTTANALDVWNPVATNRTSAATLAALTNNNTNQSTDNGLQQARLTVNGSVFHLPAGPVKLAFGGEMLATNSAEAGTSPNNVGGASSSSSMYNYYIHRNDFAEFGEAEIPVVNSAMGVPLVQRFDIDLSVRHDHYSDFGGTTNPKASFNWGVNDDLVIRGNWSTSFVAPGLVFVGNAQGVSADSGVKTGSVTVPVPVSAYPSITQFGIAGCTAASATCSASSLQGLQISQGGEPGLQPERGHGWTIGADYNPSFLPGFKLTATYWDVAFLGGVTSASQATTVENPSMNYRLQFYPNCATSAQLNTLIGAAPISAVFPACVQYTYLNNNTNYTSFWAQGVDADIGYTLDSDWGTFNVEDTFTLNTKFDEGFAYHAAPQPDLIASTLNTEGENEGYLADLFINYTGAYRNIGTPVNPVVLNSLGTYDGVGGDHVDANVTFDLHFGYSFETNQWIASSNQISFTVKDLFNQAPSYFNSTTGYDAYAANILGRTFTLSLTEKL
jgi:iron complex outermembrane receptor protein